jgi:hypothetical protein
VFFFQVGGRENTPKKSLRGGGCFALLGQCQPIQTTISCGRMPFGWELLTEKQRRADESFASGQRIRLLL